MFTARLSFPMGGREPVDVAEAAHRLLSCWYKNGQIVDDTWPFADIGTHLEAYVCIPDADALGAAHNNVYAGRALAALAPDLPSVVVLGSDPSSAPACKCASRSALVLYTTYLSRELPIRCLDCFGPAPLYRLPHVHDEEHLVFLHWAADYRACDTLQMHCTTGERFGEEQLWRHDSSLTRNGRDLAARLQDRLHTPVFYFLYKTRARDLKSELGRRCPSCGSEWLLKQRLHLFDFMCRRCNLLSAVADGVSWAGHETG